mgnify:CR=1 FL=1
MIQLTDIHKSFGSLEVLKGVNLHVNQGEIVAIVGRSGAGKTTLLQVIGTLIRPESGQVMIGGTDVFSLNERELAAFRNQHIGFIFQFHQLLPEFTAIENVMMPALIGGWSRQAAQSRAHELLVALNLHEREDHKPNELSGGEKQRVAAARAMMMHPDIILADEPSGSLDEQNKRELHQLLLDMREKFSQTMLIVTHDRELSAISDRILEIKDGQL